VGIILSRIIVITAGLFLLLLSHGEQSLSLLGRARSGRRRRGSSRPAL
jgi:hypothetical protein